MRGGGLQEAGHHPHAGGRLWGGGGQGGEEAGRGLGQAHRPGGEGGAAAPVGQPGHFPAARERGHPGEQDPHLPRPGHRWPVLE